MSVASLEPDPGSSILSVGQDNAGHWLVQESGGRLEGRFISFSTAMAFALAERHGFPGATVVVATTPLVPQISFAPAGPFETARPRAAGRQRRPDGAAWRACA